MLSEIVQRVGFPAVVKPVDGSGSLWVRRVDDLHELRDYLSRAGAGPLDDMGQRVGDRLLVESYIEGPEFSIEGYATSSHIEVVAVTEKCLGPEPYFVEVCHVVDADLSTDHRTSLERTAVAAVRALGMGSGVFHLEARLTPSGPVVMEVAARLGGDRIHKLVSAVHGQDLPEIMIRCLAGLPILPPVIEGLTRVAAAKFFTVSGPSRVADPGLLARRLLDLDGCVELAMACQPGASLQPAVDFRQRFGHIVITAPDRDRLRKTLDEVDRLIIDALGGSC
jgi:biotin carboxylase